MAQNSNKSTKGKGKRSASRAKEPTAHEKWILSKMGRHESAWAYRDTLIRVSNIEPKEAAEVVDSLVKKGLVDVDESSPFGPRYRLAKKAEEVAEAERESKEESPGAA